MRIILCAAALLASGLSAFAQDFVEARYRTWQADLGGHLSADAGGVIGTNIDLKQSVGLIENEPLNDVMIRAGVPLIGRLCVDYWWGTYEAEKVLGETIVFAGTTFDIGTTVSSSLEWRSLTALYEYPFPSLPFGDLAGLKVGPRAGIKYLKIRGELDSIIVSDSAEAAGPIPVVGGFAELSVTPFASAALEVDGLMIRDWGGGFSGEIYDIALVVRGHYGPAFAGIGYRHFAINLEDERADVDKIELGIGIRGLFLEAGARF